MLTEDDKVILLDVTLPIDQDPCMRLVVYKYPGKDGTIVHTEDFVVNERNEWYRSASEALLRAAAYIECSKNFEHFTISEPVGFTFNYTALEILDRLVNTSSVGYETRFEEVAKMRGLPASDVLDTLFKNAAYRETALGFNVFIEDDGWFLAHRDGKWWVVDTSDDDGVQLQEFNDDLMYQEDGFFDDLILWEDNQPPMLFHSGNFIDVRLQDAMLDGREHWRYEKTVKS